MDKFKAVFWDADDTLVNHKECEKQALIFLFDNIGIDYKDDYQKIFRPLDRELRGDESHNNIHVPRNDIPTFRFKLFFEEIGVDYSNYTKANDLFKKGLAHSSVLTENAYEIIKYLYDKGYMLCVVTNGLIELQKPRVMNSKIGIFISYIIVSEEVDAHKPNPLIFNTLLEKISLNPGDVIMIGDSLKNDIQGAKNANIKTIWFNAERNNNKTKILPDYEVCNLLQLKEIL